MNKIVNAWYAKAWWCYLLAPLSWLFCVIVRVRRQWLARHQFAYPVPVIVIGNVTVGGSGKTPLVKYLAQHLRDRGWQPGVVMRGYRASCTTLPHLVREEDDAQWVGDEAKLLHQSGVPVVIAPDRHAAVLKLLSSASVDIVLSDDGLQHYRLYRDLEIVVVDSTRGLGNHLCLPAGPLREPESRIFEADFIVAHGRAVEGTIRMILQPMRLVNLHTGKTKAVSALAGKTVHAVAGIAHPQRFFNSLSSLGCQVIPHAFEDHYAFQSSDVDFADGHWVIMTEKDAVKFDPAAIDERYWFLEVAAVLSKEFEKQFDQILALWKHSATY
jgi:tetraacyldisaccharide 4'-kinase